MALTKEEKSRLEQLQNEVVEKGADIGPEKRKELDALLEKDRGGLGEQASKIFGWIPKAVSSSTEALKEASKGMEYSAPYKAPPPETLTKLFGEAPKFAQPTPTVADQVAKQATPQTTVTTTAAVPSTPATGVQAPQLKASGNLATAFDELAKSYAAAPDQVKQRMGYDKSMADINDTLKKFNESYQQSQAAAKDKAERDQNRAEWASIASLLAKNIIGYTAAMKGVSADAMAYQTTDWEKRINNINDKLALELGNIKDKFKIDTEQKLGEKEALDKKYGDTLKAQLESLKLRGEGKAEQIKADIRRQEKQAELDMQAKEMEQRGQLAQAKTEGTTTTKTEDIAPKVQQALGKAADKKTMNAGIAELKTIAVQLGKDPNEIDNIAKKYQGFWDMGQPNELSSQAQSDIAQFLSGTLTKTTTTGKVPQGSVQSAQPISTQAEYNALPSGAKFSWNGRIGTKP